MTFVCPMLSKVFHHDICNVSLHAANWTSPASNISTYPSCPLHRSRRQRSVVKHNKHEIYTPVDAAIAYCSFGCKLFLCGPRMQAGLSPTCKTFWFAPVQKCWSGTGATLRQTLFQRAEVGDPCMGGRWSEGGGKPERNFYTVLWSLRSDETVLQVSNQLFSPQIFLQ